MQDQLQSVIRNMEGMVEQLRQQANTLEDAITKFKRLWASKSMPSRPLSAAPKSEPDIPMPPPHLAGGDEGILQLTLQNVSNRNDDDDEYGLDDIDEQFGSQPSPSPQRHAEGNSVIEHHVLTALQGESSLRREQIYQRLQKSAPNIPEWRIYRVLLSMDKDRVIEPVSHKPKAYRIKRSG